MREDLVSEDNRKQLIPKKMKVKRILQVQLRQKLNLTNQRIPKMKSQKKKRSKKDLITQESSVMAVTGPYMAVVSSVQPVLTMTSVENVRGKECIQITTCSQLMNLINGAEEGTVVVGLDLVGHLAGLDSLDLDPLGASLSSGVILKPLALEDFVVDHGNGEGVEMKVGVASSARQRYIVYKLIVMMHGLSMHVCSIYQLEFFHKIFDLIMHNNYVIYIYVYFI